MAYERFTDDLDVISKLDTEPNDVGGLSAEELKAKFDEAGNAIKTYINETLLPAMEGENGAENIGITGISQISTATNVQDALILICQLINDISQGAVPDGSINTLKIADAAITASKMALNTIGSGNIIDGAVITAKLADLCITTAKLAAKCVTSSKIADGAVGTTQMADGAVVNSKLGANAVQSNNIYEKAVNNSKLADDCVTNDKLADNAVSNLYTATIPHAAASWTSAGDVYYTTVSVSGLRVTDNPIIDVLADAENPNMMQAIEDWGLCIVAVSNTANTLSLMFSDIPSVDIPIKILCIRK